MPTYKQSYIPSINTPENLRTCKLGELRKFIFEYVRQNFSGKTYTNDHTKIQITVTVKSGRKTAYGEAIYLKKAAIVLILPQIIKYGVYNNFGQKKTTDNDAILGYLNFKCKCKIDGQVECVRLAVQFQKGGKFYYNIEINKK